MTAPRTPPSTVRVALPVPLATQFDYALPADCRAPLPGARIEVPFGPRRLVGICTAIDPEQAHENPKPLRRVLDREPLVDAEGMRLAEWLSHYYHHPLGEVFATVLPSSARHGASTAEDTVEVFRASAEAPAFGRAKQQQALWEHLAHSESGLTAEALRSRGYSRAVINGLRERGGLVVHAAQATQASGADAAALETPLTLSAEQAAAKAMIEQGSGYRCTLLEGVTGSGKTEVYLQLIAACLARGQQALVLVPEIALTPQTLARFTRRFGHAEAMHSQLSDKQRWRVWLDCRAGRVPVLIGTRSASFTPFPNLGLIVVDEEHDGSFKQADGLRYSARDLAVKRAHDLNIPLVLGSATPSLESLHNAGSGRYQHCRLLERAGGAQMPRYRLLDVRGEQRPDGLSDPLKRVARQHLEAGNQVLVFINRRGFAPSLLCARCGWRPACDACELPLTYHRPRPRAGASLHCHHCGLVQPAPPRCGQCQEDSLLPIGVGTQRSEEGLAELFPDVPIHRIDRDTVRTARQLNRQLEAIHRAGPALLVGTQMLAKGHHFPNVTLVAILNADAGFASADFRAPERTAQLIVQVAGRAGRGAKPGEVWVQTLQPESPLLAALVEDGYPGFAAEELARREAAALPPFGAMVLIRAESTQAQAAQDLLQQVKTALKSNADAIDAGSQVGIAGPVPAPMPRIAGRLRFQLMLLAHERRPLHRILNPLRSQVQAPRDVRWSIDVDPYDAF